jgi:hypothetical protein
MANLINRRTGVICADFQVTDGDRGWPGDSTLCTPMTQVWPGDAKHLPDFFPVGNTPVTCPECLDEINEIKTAAILDYLMSPEV